MFSIWYDELMISKLANNCRKMANLVIPALVVSTLACHPAYSSAGLASRVGEMATFEYLRVSLVARDQGDLFAKKFDPEDRVEKDED